MKVPQPLEDPLLATFVAVHLFLMIMDRDDKSLLEDYEYRDDKPPKRPGSSSSLVAYVGPQLEKNTMYYLILKKTTFYIYLIKRPKKQLFS